MEDDARCRSTAAERFDLGCLERFKTLRRTSRSRADYCLAPLVAGKGLVCIDRTVEDLVQEKECVSLWHNALRTDGDLFVEVGVVEELDVQLIPNRDSVFLIGRVRWRDRRRHKAARQHRWSRPGETRVR
jgi:hypothetical protein